MNSHLSKIIPLFLFVIFLVPTINYADNFGTDKVAFAKADNDHYFVSKKLDNNNGKIQKAQLTHYAEEIKKMGIGFFSLAASAWLVFLAIIVLMIKDLDKIGAPFNSGLKRKE